MGAVAWIGGFVVAAICVVAFWRALARSDEPWRLAWRWGCTISVGAAMWFYASRVIGFEARGGLLANFGYALMLVAGIAVGGIVIGILWAGSFGRWLARPLAGLYDDGGAELRPTPSYSAAIAHRKQGRTGRAVEEIRRQLERFPGDWEGVLLLAEIQARDLQDLGAAEVTLHPWLSGELTDPGRRAIALTKLADWHLQVRHDADAARRCLAAIVTAAPDSEAAFLAEQRLAHLEFEAQPKPGPLRVRAGSGRPVAVGTPPPVPDRRPEEEAARLAEHLAAHPHDVAAREQLAILQAWTFARPDLARTELETLLGFPRVSERELVHWLNLLADVEIQVGKDLPAARAALQRIIDRDPQVAAAERARHRMHFLERELSRHKGPRVVRA